jgi:hypothetical protein
MSYNDFWTLLIFHGWRIVGAFVCGGAAIGFFLAVLSQAGLIDMSSNWTALPAAAITAVAGYLFWLIGNAGVKWHTRRGKTLSS